MQAIKIHVFAKICWISSLVCVLRARSWLARVDWAGALSSPVRHGAGQWRVCQVPCPDATTKHENRQKENIFSDQTIAAEWGHVRVGNSRGQISVYVLMSGCRQWDMVIVVVCSVHVCKVCDQCGWISGRAVQQRLAWLCPSPRYQ